MKKRPNSGVCVHLTEGSTEYWLIYNKYENKILETQAAGVYLIDQKVRRYPLNMGSA